jgi:hypothetical protein
MEKRKLFIYSGVGLLSLTTKTTSDLTEKPYLHTAT